MTEAQGTDRIELVATFVRIVEAGSLSAAADQLGTTQPTVSRRLQSLESYLGVKLLQRSTHGMKLTEDGDRFFTRAKELLTAWRTMEEELRGVKEAPFGLLRVVVPHAFGQGPLVEPLLEYLKNYPQVSIEWILHDLNPNFIADGIDCAIHLGAVDDPSLVAVHLAEVPRIAVASPSLCKGDTASSIKRLPSLPWIALTSFYRDEVVLMPKNGSDSFRFDIRPRFCTDSVYALRNATLAGLGASLISSWIVADDLASGRLVHLVPDWYAVSLPVYLTYPYARFYPAKLRRFLDLMRKRMPRLVGVTTPEKAQVLLRMGNGERPVTKL